jgi:predicted metal-dependent RNase
MEGAGAAAAGDHRFVEWNGHWRPRPQPSRARAPGFQAHGAVVGFQAAGTRGRLLVDGAKAVKMHGRVVNVTARIALIESMSAHADQAEILRWLKGFRRPPAMTFVVHGEPAAQGALQERIRAMPVWKTLAPEYAQGVEL